MRKILIILFFLCIQYSSATSDDYDKYPLELLLFQEIRVASVKSTTLRETPGIVSVFSEKDIKDSGARDLMDLLEMVPGFHSGIDVTGVLGLGIRGIWSGGPKILLLIDGHEMNELLYSSFPLGKRFALDQIQRIEIIRGPGSSLYGDNAQQAVIKIETKKSSDYENGELNFIYGHMNKTFGRRAIHAGYGLKPNEQTEWTFSIFASEGNLSDRKNRDFFGQEYDMTDASGLKSFNLISRFSAYDFNLNIFSDNFVIEEKDGYGSNLSDTMQIAFESFHINADYSWQIMPALTIKPIISYKREMPWKTAPGEKALTDTGFSVEDLTYSAFASRLKTGFEVSYSVFKKSSILGGIIYSQDTAKSNLDENYAYGNFSLSYSNFSAYAQGLFFTPLINLTLGARYESHNSYGESLVPRIVLTKTLDPFHFKLLGSQAFRAPSLANISLNEQIEPEQGFFLELETG